MMMPRNLVALKYPNHGSSDVVGDEMNLPQWYWEYFPQLRPFAHGFRAIEQALTGSKMSK